MELSDNLYIFFFNEKKLRVTILNRTFLINVFRKMATWPLTERVFRGICRKQILNLSNYFFADASESRDAAPSSNYGP